MVEQSDQEHLGKEEVTNKESKIKQLTNKNVRKIKTTRIKYLDRPDMYRKIIRRSVMEALMG
jgi:hypothetical protein